MANSDEERGPTVPRWRLERIAEDLGGEVKYITCVERNLEYNKIVIEWGHKTRK